MFTHSYTDVDSDAIYIILNGRLRTSYRDSRGKLITGKEFGRGESIGEIELMTAKKRPSTLRSIRNTHVVRIQLSSFQSLSATQPFMAMQISRIIAKNASSLIESGTGGSNQVSKRTIQTIAVVPLSDDIPIEEFCVQLTETIAQIGLKERQSMTILNSATIVKYLGANVLSKRGEAKLAGYLGHLGESMKVIFFIPDLDVDSIWTETCMHQADSILLVGSAQGSPEITEIEKLIVNMTTTAQKKLVLLHPGETCIPGLTKSWIKVINSPLTNIIRC